jgi:hypothetical protein
LVPPTAQIQLGLGLFEVMLPYERHRNESWSTADCGLDGTIGRELLEWPGSHADMTPEFNSSYKTAQITDQASEFALHMYLAVSRFGIFEITLLYIQAAKILFLFCHRDRCEMKVKVKWGIYQYLQFQFESSPMFVRIVYL